MVNWAKKNGGIKNMKLMADREFIRGAIDRFGLEETCRLYGITKLETLYRVLNTDDTGRQRKLSKEQKALAKSDIALAGYDAMNQRINQAISYFEKKVDKKMELVQFTGWLLKEVPEDEDKEVPEDEGLD